MAQLSVLATLLVRTFFRDLSQNFKRLLTHSPLLSGLGLKRGYCSAASSTLTFIHGDLVTLRPCNLQQCQHHIRRYFFPSPHSPKYFLPKKQFFLYPHVTMAPNCLVQGNNLIKLFNKDLVWYKTERNI